MHADNAQDRIKDCTEAFFSEMSKYADKRDLDTPQTAVYTPTTFRREDPEEIVTQPSKLVRTDNPVKQFFFDETAEWLASSNAGFDFPPALDPEQTDDIAGYYRKRLFEFAQLTLDYTGQFGFSESDFYAAYRDHIKPKYQAKHTHRIVVPLPGLSLHGTANLRQKKLSLPNQIDIDSVGRNRCELPSEVEISRLTDWELAGVQTYGSPHVTSDLSTLRRKLRWYYKLMIDIEIEDLPAAHEERRPGIDRSWTSLLAKQIGIRIAKQLVTVLRLFEPRNYVGIGPAYVTERSWLTHRNLCMDISGYFSSSDSQETPIVKLERYQLDRENYDELNSFWRKLATACDPKADTELSSAIRRFNQTFKSKSYEDKIVDSYIGFEKTLANNEGVSSFRLRAKRVRAILVQILPSERTR